MIEIKKIIAFLKKDFSIQKSYRMSFVLNIFSILASVVTFYFIAKVFGKNASPYLSAYGGQYFPFVLIGIAFSDFLFTGLRAFSGAIRSEQVTGTLGSLLMTPTKLSTILIGSAVWDFAFAALRVFIYLFFGAALFGVSINPSGIFISLVILVLTAASFSAMGIVSGSFIMLFKKGDPVTWALAGVSSLLGGVYYPVDVLPQVMQKASYFLPITYSLRAVRSALLGGASLTALTPDIFILALFSAALLPFSIIIFRYSVKMAKSNGTLLQY